MRPFDRAFRPGGQEHPRTEHMEECGNDDQPEVGWNRDPAGAGKFRYWNGSEWTAEATTEVHSNGMISTMAGGHVKRRRVLDSWLLRIPSYSTRWLGSIAACRSLGGTSGDLSSQWRCEPWIRYKRFKQTARTHVWAAWERPSDPVVRSASKFLSLSAHRGSSHRSGHRPRTPRLLSHELARPVVSRRAFGPFAYSGN